MKKVMKWASVLLLTPILLFLLLVFLLYLPPFQNWAVKKVAAYASDQTGMDISVGHVSLRFPLDLTLDEVKVIKDNDSIPGLRDTIANVGKVFVDIQLRPLVDKKVEIDAMGLENLKLNTDGLIDDIRVKGNVEKLDLECHGVDLKESLANVNVAKLDSACLEICLADTVPPDTTESTNNWIVKVEKLQLARTRLSVHLPGDTLQMKGYFSSLNAEGGNIDFAKSEYKISKIDIEGSNLQYDNRFASSVPGLDTNHLDAQEIQMGVDSLSYSSDGLKLALRSCSFKEKSGLQIDELRGHVSLDSVSLHLPDAYLKTPDSKLATSINLDLNTFDTSNPGKLNADIDCYLGKQDIMRFLGDMPGDFVRKWPNQPLAIKGKARGNMSRLDFNGLHVSLPTAFQLRGDGYVAQLNDFDHLKADVNLKGSTSDLDFVTSLLDKSVTDKVRIPKGISIDGKFKANGHKYGADFMAEEGGGKIKAAIAYDTDLTKYSATVDADRFPLQDFLPGMGLSPLTAHIEADGQGTDIMSPSTTLRAKAKIGKFHYDQYDLDGMEAVATLSKGRLSADIDSHNPLLDGNISFDALMNAKRLQGVFVFDLSKADFYRLKLMDTPFTASGCAHLDIDTDLKEYYKVLGSLGDMTISYKNTYFKPDDIILDLLTKKDTTYARVDCGDFHLDMNGRGGYKTMLKEVESFSKELTKQINDKHFNQMALRQKLPDANIFLTSGQDNFFLSLIEEEGYSFKNLLVDMNSSRTDGLNGNIKIDGLVVDSIQLDSIRFAIVSDSTGFKYNGRVRNAPDHPQYAFSALLDGSILDDAATINAKLFDKEDRLGFDLGASAHIENNGVMIQMTREHPVIGYINFDANEGNYVFIGDDRRVSANLKLRAEDGMHIDLYTNDDNANALQDLTLSLGKLDLGKILSLVPYMPDINGVAEGDFHIVQTSSDLSVSSSVNVANLIYEKMPLGNLGAEFVYLPNSDGTHHLDGILLSEGEEDCDLVGNYNPKGEGYIDAKLNMKRTPLSIINGFIPDQLFGLKGTAEGDLSIKGSLSKPNVNGELYLENTFIFSEPYGMEVKVADDPIRIVGSNILFENFEIQDANKTPLNISGYYDFSDFSNMKIDLKMRARNFMIINAKENLKSEAFGKAFVNFFGSMKGPVDAMTMRGRLDVLGSTDMTYVLRDSPLTADTRLEELVKFVNFNDTIEQVITRPPLTGFNMDLTMSVDEGARIKCDLNSDHSNYIDLVGGGNLRMRYNPIDNLQLTGRYILHEAEMKYSLPVIPLKTFTIQEGSYIDFKGDPMNPTLNITATENRKASVANEGGGTRSVDFTCGVVITQTLNNMGLEFIINAPDDVAIGTELASMSLEERGKVAVTMLTTGMYLADGNTSGFTMNGALSSFLQNEINNITGNALRTLDLSVGVDNATDASGAMHTDYSFKFAKRFWNNRLRIIIGGKVSTGSDVPQQDHSFLTNVTFEYRLSATSNKYLKLFYNRDSYDWLEGQIGEYGGGFLWRRKLDHFMDIFKFKSDSQLPPSSRMPKQLPKDTISTDSTSIPKRHENPED